MYVNDLNTYLRSVYGHKLYKLSLNGGMTCPNRDGRLGRRGCIFCSQGGSGDFAADAKKSIGEQIEQAKLLVQKKIKQDGYIAYFQAYTNTYAPVSYLERIFMEAVTHPQVKILSIATRPDCLEEEKIALLKRINKIKPVWVELGFQTCHEKSIALIRRGYQNSVFEKAVRDLNAAGVDVIVHVIIGLPNEGERELLETIRYLNGFNIRGIKLQLLHILRGTDLEQYYKEHPFSVYSMEEYADVLFSAVEHLRRDIVIHRLTGDGPKKLLVAPLWSGNKRMVMNYLHSEMKRRNIIQGAKAMVTGGLACQ